MVINIPYAIAVDVYLSYCQVTNFILALGNSINQTLLATLIPGILMIVSTILIYKKLSDQRKKLNQTKKEFSFLKILISLYVFFLVCTVPFALSAISCYIMKKPFFGSLLYEITNYLATLYVSFDFFVYIFSNRRFRDECAKMFCRIASKKQFKTEAIKMGNVRGKANI